MTTDTRVTGVLDTSRTYTRVERATLANPDVWMSYASVNNSACVRGIQKSIISERSGKFQPGLFRANPTTITSVMGVEVPSMVVSKPNGGYIYRLVDGPAHRNDSSSYYSAALWDTNLQNMSFLKAKAKLKDADLEVGTMLGELKETLVMLKNPFKSLTDEMYNLYNHGWKRVNKKVSFLDAISGAWLTYRYGILPLVSDINAIIAAYQRKFEEMQGMHRQKAGAHNVVHDAFSGIESYGGFQWLRTYVRRREWISTTHIYYQMLLKANDQYKLAALGLSPDQWPSTAWELVTLSFVWDWFFTIGTWLKAITPDVAITHLGNCTTQKMITEFRLNAVQTRYPTGLEMEQHPVENSYRIQYVQLIRKVNTSTPLIPAYNPNPLNLKRTLDSLSLIWGRMSGPLRKAYANKRHGS